MPIRLIKMIRKFLAYCFVLFLGLFFVGCQNKATHNAEQKVVNSVQFAKGFALYKYKNYTKLVIKSPYPNAKKQFDYYLVKADTDASTYSISLSIWGLIGTDTPNGWDSDQDMTYNPDTRTLKITR